MSPLTQGRGLKLYPTGPVALVPSRPLRRGVDLNHAGLMEGLSPISTKEDTVERYGRDALDLLEKSGAYKAGNVAGIMGQFAIPYAGAAPKVSAALSKIPQVARMGKIGQGVVRSVATDIAVGTPLNINYALNKEGLRGEEAMKSIALNTAIDLVAGGALEVIAGAILKNGKKVANKAEFGVLPDNEKNRLVRSFMRLPGQGGQ